ncbi:MAG: RNA polymerase factor sigma-54 [Pararhizobium sp.]
MALSAGLQLRQSQSLVMTPQLMQSIRLLQLTHTELARFVEEEVERNPLLDHLGAEDHRPEAPAEPQPEQPTGDGDWFAASERAEGEPLSERLDSDFDNVFPDDGPAQRADTPELLGLWKSMPGSASIGAAEGFDLDAYGAPAETLRAYVLRQVALSFFPEAERAVAAALTDHLDDSGYLDCDLSDVAKRAATSLEAVEAVLARLQGLDPSGIFARSLAECLAIQLAERDRLDPAMRTLLGHLDLLARRDFAALKRLCGVDEEDLLAMLAEIRALDPKPGNRFQNEALQAIVADVLVMPAPDGGWRVELNAETLPRVLVNHDYYVEVSRLTRAGSADHAFLGTCLQNANWLTRSLDQRARTILRVAREIVRQQDQFLLHGVDQLRPLNLKTIAEAIGMHESTVSRATSNKYMMTPRGVFELKYFFPVPSAALAGGDAHSAEAVRNRIRTLIAGEDSTDALSDDAIVESLRQSGVDIARRTVAKYREAMNIPSSVQRRREKRARERAASTP